MAAMVPRASLLWSPSPMLSPRPDDGDDLEQQQRLVDAPEDALDDARTPVSPRPPTPLLGPLTPPPARQDHRQDRHGQLPMGPALPLRLWCVPPALSRRSRLTDLPGWMADNVPVSSLRAPQKHAYSPSRCGSKPWPLSFLAYSSTILVHQTPSPAPRHD
jgi:hypothetical protein